MAKKRDHLTLVSRTANSLAREKGSVPISSSSPADPTAEVDELYRRPLGEFTAERNALAKRLGKDGAAIKTLEKPTVPAWAVNQLYWRERNAYDDLVAASEALRAEHRKHLSGTSADIRAAEKTHREAVKAAGDTVRRLLSDAGETASPATMSAVTETLEALPTADPPGRLVRPLKPRGFEALAGLAGRPLTGFPAPQPKKEPAPKTGEDAAKAREKEEAARRAAEAAEREAEEERQKRRDAHAAAIREAEEAVERARTALDEAHQEVERRSEALAAARETLRQLKRVTVI